MDSTGRSGSISALLVAHTHSPYAWQADVDTTVVIPALSLLYLFALGRLGAPRWRIACYAGSMALLAVAFWTPLHHLALHYLLTRAPAAERDPRRVGAAPRGARDLAGRWRRRSRGDGRGGSSPTRSSRCRSGSSNYFAWHAPPVYDAALDHQAWLIHVEHAFYFGTGFLMWWPLVHDVPRRLASSGRAAYAFAAFVLASPLGLLLALLPRPVYDFYVHAPRALGADAASPTRRSRA